jgi:hypothetical protein
MDAIVREFLDALASFLFSTGIFVEQHAGAITAIASIAIAGFTWTLWRATSGMLKTASQQSADTNRSIAEAARAASAMEKVAAHVAVSEQLSVGGSLQGYERPDGLQLGLKAEAGAAPVGSAPAGSPSTLRLDDRAQQLDVIRRWDV